MDFWDKVRADWERALKGSEAQRSDSVIQMKPMYRLSLMPGRPIAVTGRSGSGKSSLFRELNVGARVNSSATARSRKVERYRSRIRISGRTARVEAHIPPGQISAARNRGLERVMRGSGIHPDGVIHSVCWGHNTIWDEEVPATRGAIELKGEKVSREALLSRNLDEELDDFEDISKRLKLAWRGRSGIWLFIVTTKCDLYWEEIDAVRDYYIPKGKGEESEFALRLMDLVGSVGMGNFERISVLPFSSRLETYRFGNEVMIRPLIDARQAALLADNFLETVGEVV